LFDRRVAVTILCIIMERCKDFTFTRDVLEKAEKLHEQGIQWDEVADVLGCTIGSLTGALSRSKNGRNKFLSEKMEQRDRDIVKLVLKGFSVSEISKSLGVSRQIIHRNLLLMGLDKETIKEILDDPEACSDLAKEYGVEV